MRSQSLHIVVEKPCKGHAVADFLARELQHTQQVEIIGTLALRFLVAFPRKTVVNDQRCKLLVVAGRFGCCANLGSVLQLRKTMQK